MSNYLGFNPCEEEQYYFISYNNEDAERVGKIAAPLSEKLPFWYDYGIEYGDEWEATISQRIADAKGVLFFFSKGILYKSRPFSKKEFQVAKTLGKPIWVVMMDKITIQDVPKDKLLFWADVKAIQDIKVGNNDSETVCNMILEAIGEVPGDVLKPAPKVQVTRSVKPENIEPDTESHFISPHKVGIFGVGYTKQEKKDIHTDAVSRLKEDIKFLKEEKEKNEFNAVELYRHSRSAMIVVDELSKYENVWNYREEKAIADFNSNYDRNIRELKEKALHGDGIATDYEWSLVKQVIFGLDDVIQALESNI